MTELFWFFFYLPHILCTCPLWHCLSSAWWFIHGGRTLASAFQWGKDPSLFFFVHKGKTRRLFLFCFYRADLVFKCTFYFTSAKCDCAISSLARQRRPAWTVHGVYLGLRVPSVFFASSSPRLSNQEVPQTHKGTKLESSADFYCWSPAVCAGFLLWQIMWKTRDLFRWNHGFSHFVL